jgi:O-antigen ligase
MRFPILPAGAKSIADDPLSLRLLYLLFGVLLAILPLAHVTALRNSLIGLIGLLALLNVRTAPWKSIPGLVPWIVWLSFAALSIVWSALPDVSFQSFRSDQFYPFVIFMVSFLIVRHLWGRLAVAIGTAAGTLLCLATMFAASAMGADPDASGPEPGVMGWLAWKAGNTTDASTYVAFVAVPLFLILLTSRHAWRRWSAAIWLLLFATIAFLSESRTLVATLFVSFVGFLIALGVLRGRLHWKSVLVAIGIGVAVSAACLETISRARMPLSPSSGRSAAVEMIMQDPRPAMWAVYLELARKHPWLGIGLGRTVPPRAYRLHDDADLKRIDLQASTHAHNVLLDLVLQVGLIGLAIWVWLHVEVLRLAWRCARGAGDREKAWAAAAIALALAMLVKNSTNDLIVYGNAILFWALMGTMLGLIWAGARPVTETTLAAEAPRAARAQAFD